MLLATFPAGIFEVVVLAGSVRLILAQDPASAKFDSMPRSVSDAGLADIVAPAEELAGRIQAWLARSPLAGKADEAVDAKMRGGLEKILILLRTRTGHDFSFYKKNTLYRRIERRMATGCAPRSGRW